MKDGNFIYLTIIHNTKVFQKTSKINCTKIFFYINFREFPQKRLQRSSFLVKLKTFNYMLLF